MWGVAQLRPQPNAVALAIRNLERQSFETFYPTFSLRRVRRNKLQTVATPVFAGYIFVNIGDHQRWAAINSTYGVSRLLVRKSPYHEYDEPSVISDAFITQLKSCSERDDEAGWGLKVGTTVTILHGPFAGRSAVVTWSTAERVRLVLWLLNRDVPITLAVTDVVAI
jgi:transcription antitermination factor NusG